MRHIFLTLLCAAALLLSCEKPINGYVIPTPSNNGNNQTQPQKPDEPETTDPDPQTPVVTPPDGFVIVGYATYWDKTIPNPEYLTHICYAFAHINNDFETLDIKTPSRLTTIAGLKKDKPALKVLLSIGGWRMVYAVGAVLLGIGFTVAMSSKGINVKTEIPVTETVMEKAKTGKSGIREFMGNAPVIFYFIMILLPFMMSLASREYFLPLKAGESNVSEITVSRFYLICGLVFLYLGPAITRYIIKYMGLFKGICLATGLMAQALLSREENLVSSMILNLFVHPMNA